MITITPSVLRLAYELLRATEPFKGWKLPTAGGVQFRISNMNDRVGDFCFLRNGVPMIRISAKGHGTLGGVLMTMAHEMVHLHCDLECRSDKSEHGRRFMEAAKRVCAKHVWDWKHF